MMNYEKIHIWQLPTNKIYVKLDKTKNELINEAIEVAENIIEGKTRRKADKLVTLLNYKASEYNCKNIKSSRIIFYWRRGGCSIPLWAIIEMSKLVKDSSLSLEKIEKNITYYKGKSVDRVIKANFPLQINLDMVALYFHLFGDGSFSENNSTAAYSQLDEENRKNFIQKLKNAFGEFDSSKMKGSKYNLNFPSLFAYVLKHIFEINTFLSNEGRIPNGIKRLSYILKFSGAIAFLIDEGYINDGICFSSSNKLFLKDFQELLLSIGYESRTYKNVLRLKNEQVPRFYEDYLKIISLSPCCNLNSKEENLKILYSINKRKFGYHSFSESDILSYQDKIMKILFDNHLKTNEIRRILFKEYQMAMSYTTLLRILKSMEKHEIIKRDKISERVNKWFITNRD